MNVNSGASGLSFKKSTDRIVKNKVIEGSDL